MSTIQLINNRAFSSEVVSILKDISDAWKLVLPPSLRSQDFTYPMEFDVIVKDTEGNSSDIYTLHTGQKWHIVRGDKENPIQLKRINSYNTNNSITLINQIETSTVDVHLFIGDEYFTTRNSIEFREEANLRFNSKVQLY
ncbi:hypothetical protein [uncultured Tenacibaculum sp.]|uniref:hypothetical protein n=1 Tax=uncultured Tenacibaculum sp. TaxID=174713 RepID=UPI0026070FCB|nr:hypothetical protein [uncultured Tenacibaculum sp.]